MFTILHISDLHRSYDEPVSNDSLLAALLSDRDRYRLETPSIFNPNAALISGDVIQGVLLGSANYKAELDNQYEVAYNFLVGLADRFFDGDRSKIVIVPGNHDVCWNTARDSMVLVDPAEEPQKVGPHLFRPDSVYRWCWEDRRIYKITESNKYASRHDSYWNFIEHFYDGVSLKHPVERSRGFNYFELDNGRILVTAFESTHGNDCFCRQGAIKNGSVGKCALALRDMIRNPVLSIAAWHHSLQGPPHGDDYMDVSTVHEMIGNGFRLGLHGHQHHADASAYNINLPESLSMAIASAGSLCAGARELPRGTDRQYNIVVIDDDYTSARVHVREMSQGNQFGSSRHGIFSPDGFVELSWKLPPLGQSPERGVELFNKETIILSEDALRNGDANTTIKLLESIEKPPGSHARTLFIDAARYANKWELIINCIVNPASISEFIELVNAFGEVNQYPEAMALINNASEYGVDENTQKDLRERFEISSNIRR